MVYRVAGLAGAALTALAGLALSAAVLPAAAQTAPARPALQHPSNMKTDYQLAQWHLQRGVDQFCAGDAALLRYPYEAGYRRAVNAAERHEKDTKQKGMLDAVQKLPVRQSRPDEARAVDARLAAAASFASAIAILEKLAAAQPGELSLQRDLAVATSHLAKVSGIWEKARNLHQKAVDLQKAVVAKQPADKTWPHDLAGLYQGLGSAQFGMGGEPPARAAKRAELDIREKLAEAEPSNRQLQHELALNYDRLGVMFHTIVNVSQARDAFKAGFEIHEKLAKLEPANLAWQRDFARNRFDAGDFETSKGRTGTGPDMGAQLLQQALQMRTAIVARDPADVDAQTDLRDNWLRIAGQFRNGERPDEAMAVYRQGLAEMRRLAAAHPADPGWLYYQLEFQFMIGFLIQDEIQPRLGTRTLPPREKLEAVIAGTDEVFRQMLATMRELGAQSLRPETLRIYETAQAPRLCTISL
ncbi:MAG: hypothetical protein EOO28_19590 [Comamonadaceae bacterium]|nr:MAG: hypothetical protein EOO28_19590 [Comamonadaceae bacterium]